MVKRKSSRTACAWVLALGAMSATLPAQAVDNLVLNGSLNFTGSGPPTGWTFLNPAGEYWVSYGNQPSPDGGSYLGIQFLEAFAPRFNAQGFQQTIGGLQVGASYALSFYSMTNHASGSPTARQDWRVSFGADTQTSQQTFFTGTVNWIQSTLAFTAAAATQSLIFLAEYLPGSYPEMLNIDGIVLTQTTPAVPEPSRLATLAGGLAALGGWVAFRRRSGA
jgi:hypothetical protein